MLVSGTFTKAVMYLMLLSDSIIAGYFIGESGVAGINAITPVTAIVTFFGDLVSTGVGIVYTREVGAMRKERADEIYGQGLIISIGLGVLSAALLLVIKGEYFRLCGVTGDILDRALEYYSLVPINSLLTIVIFYLEQMVYSDGDELCNNICYGFQIGGNVICSIILTRFMGMTGIILGSVIGNSLGILTCLWHYFRKGNSLHFRWHLSIRDFLLTSRYSIVDSSVYICWGLMDYVMIGFVSGSYGETGQITLAVVASLIDQFGWSRRKATIIEGAIAMAISIVICLGYNKFYFEVKLPNTAKDGSAQLLDIFDYLSNNILMPIVAIGTCILIGWIVKPKTIIDEATKNGEKFGRKAMYPVMIKFIAPVMLFVLLLGSLGLFN